LSNYIPKIFDEAISIEKEIEFKRKKYDSKSIDVEKKSKYYVSLLILINKLLSFFSIILLKNRSQNKPAVNYAGRKRILHYWTL